MNISLAGMAAGFPRQGASLLGRTTNLEGEDVLTAIIAHFEDTGLRSLYQCLLHLLLHLQPCPPALCLLEKHRLALHFTLTMPQPETCPGD